MLEQSRVPPTAAAKLCGRVPTVAGAESGTPTAAAKLCVPTVAGAEQGTSTVAKTMCPDCCWS
jgi:hypothetical protein